MHTRRFATMFALVLAASCSDKDNSAVTDRASEDLRNAQSAVRDQSKELTADQAEVERRKRQLVKEQQELADKEKALEADRLQLGSARGTLAEARVAYGAAVTERFAKLDAALAALATQTDAASIDALAGLRARRELLATKLAAMPTTAEAIWASYTKDVDTTFDAIELDLRAAKR